MKINYSSKYIFLFSWKNFLFIENSQVKNILKNIIKEEFEQVMKKYSQNEISDAILKKHFIHTNDGNVYSPVKFDKDHVIGVNNDCEHVNIPLDEISMIQSKEERFGK